MHKESKQPVWTEDFYDLLGIARTASLTEIHAAYTQAKNAYSKDSAATYSLFSSEENGQMLAQLETAYMTLSNIDKKREYDRWLYGQSQNAGSQPQTRTTPAATGPTDIPSFFQKVTHDRHLNVAQPPPVVETKMEAEPTPVDSPSGLMPESHSVAPEPPQAGPTPAVFTEYNGAALRSIREKLGLNSEDVCRITKIPMKFLRAIEDSNPTALPARVYLQGFIKILAKLYQLDSQKTLESYLKSVESLPKP